MVLFGKHGGRRPNSTVMRPTTYPVGQLRELFEEQTVLSLGEISEQLGTSSRTTLFRKLGALNYRASYSHRGMYYVLNEAARYDENGLWTWAGIRFSRVGSLSKTLCELVKKSEAGRFAKELHALVKVAVHNTLAVLYQRGKLQREQVGSEYLYLWPSRAVRQRQRREAQLQAEAGVASAGVQEVHRLRSEMRTLLSVLNEKQRRLYLGLESLRIGTGGDTHMAMMAGVDVKTVAKGRRELQSREVDMDRIRAVGAGRPALKQNER